MASRLQDVIQRGLSADQPLATEVAPGTLYYSSDLGNTQRSNGTVWETYTDGAGTAVAAISTTVLTTGTGATYTVPAGVTAIFVRLQGAGGGGGGGERASSQVGCGSSGQTGGYCEKSYNVTPADTFLYTVGVKGTGGVAGNNAGTDGTATTFDNGGSIVTAAGGKAGGSMATGTSYTSSAANTIVASTGGDINLSTTANNRGLRLSGTQAIPASAFDSMFGHGGGVAFDATAPNGEGYGAGGTGAFAQTANRAGGNGADGVIVITEYGI